MEEVVSYRFDRDTRYKIAIMQVNLDYNVIPNNHFRDEMIRIKYKYLKNREAGGKKITSKQAREMLAEEYFMSLKNIEFILYGKNKND